MLDSRPLEVNRRKVPAQAALFSRCNFARIRVNTADWHHTPLAAGLPVKLLLMLGGTAMALLAALSWLLLQRRRLNRHGDSLLHLLNLADRLEADLKTCRAGLQQAHAVMSLNPDLPAASEQDASHAVDAGLRALLQQRLWIRDHSENASQHELDQAVSSMQATRDRLQPLLHSLEKAQQDLDSAMRQQIQRQP